MATAVAAHALVLTHLSVVGPTAAVEPTLLSRARSTFVGPVTVARDLSRFCLDSKNGAASARSVYKAN